MYARAHTHTPTHTHIRDKAYRRVSTADHVLVHRCFNITDRHERQQTGDRETVTTIRYQVLGLYMYIYIYRERERDVYIYIYIYREREREREYDSRRAFVVHSDTKRPKVENMERRPVIIKHRTQPRRTSRIAGRPARDVWKHELYEAKARQIIRKCEILKQMTREARKRIYHLGKLKKGHPKSPDVSNGNSRAESRSVWR